MGMENSGRHLCIDNRLTIMGKPVTIMCQHVLSQSLTHSCPLLNKGFSAFPSRHRWQAFASRVHDSAKICYSDLLFFARMSNSQTGTALRALVSGWDPRASRQWCNRHASEGKKLRTWRGAEFTRFTKNSVCQPVMNLRRIYQSKKQMNTTRGQKLEDKLCVSGNNRPTIWNRSTVMHSSVPHQSSGNSFQHTTVSQNVILCIKSLIISDLSDLWSDDDFNLRTRVCIKTILLSMIFSFLITKIVVMTDNLVTASTYR